MIKLPGLIDIHVHLRDPGQTYKEDFFTGSQAALAGGFTQIFDMPNNNPPTTTIERLNEKITSAQEKTVCDIGFYFGSLGDNLEQFKEAQEKVFGLKLYLNVTTGNYLIDIPTVRKIYETWNSEKPILLHGEEDVIPDVLPIIQDTNQSTHFAHVSSQSELSQILQMKMQGLPVTCGVTPHHLFLTQEDTQTLGSYAHMKPYLKSKSDVEFLWNHLSDIDVIESDHAPHTKEEKESANPPFGVPGLETTLPLLLQASSENKLTIDDINRLLYENPTKILHLQTQEETYIEVDENEEYEIRNEDLKTKAGWTPFAGWRVKGKVKKVVLRGKMVYQDGEVTAKKGSGEVLS